MLTAKTDAACSAMKISQIVAHRVRVPLNEPFRISNGAVAEKESILVEIRTDRGVTGWGEASPMSGSFYSEDTPDSVWNALRERLIPFALGEREIDPSRFFERLRDFSGDAFAKAGLEGAVWDAYARSLNLPLYKLLGGSRKSIPSGLAVGIYDTVAELIERVDRYVADGYRRVKIKIQPGWDVEPVAALRGRYPNLALMVDANAAYTLRDVDIFRQLDDFDLMMFEQPLARGAHDESAKLQRRVRTPICADESAESMADLEEIIAKEAARIINIKIQRVGGLSEACLMLERAKNAGLGCWVGTMPELGIASAQGLQFATLEGFNYPTDIESSKRWFVDDVVEPELMIDSKGYIYILDGPGMGFEVSREKVRNYTLASEEFRV